MCLPSWLHWNSLFFLVMISECSFPNINWYFTLFTCCCHITLSILEIKQRGSESAKYLKGGQPKDEEEGLDEVDEEEHGDTLCGACGENYASDEFWICCDICEKWFHGKCVKITPARAEHIKQYKCPSCSNKRARPWYIPFEVGKFSPSVIPVLNSTNCLVGKIFSFLVLCHGRCIEYYGLRNVVIWMYSSLRVVKHVIFYSELEYILVSSLQKNICTLGVVGIVYRPPFCSQIWSLPYFYFHFIGFDGKIP